LVSTIAAIAIAGVAVGVAALVIVIGVMDGAKEQLFTKILEVYPHVEVRGLFGGAIDRPEAALGVARSMPEVALAEPTASRFAMFSARKPEAPAAARDRQFAGGRFLAIEPSAIAPGAGDRLFPLADAEGRDVALEEGAVWIGRAMAEKLNAAEGDNLLIVMAPSAASAGRSRSSALLRVGGIFATGYHEFDAMTVVGTLADLRARFGIGEGADSVQIKLRDPYREGEFRRALGQRLGETFVIATWRDRSGDFLRSIDIQRIGLYLILMLIVMVAGFNIIGTMLLMIIDKRREIGMMKAMGVSEGMLLMTFLRVGGSIGFIGTVAGVAIGLFGCWLLGDVIRLEMPPSVYNFENLPVLVKPWTVVSIVASAMGACLISALLPAMQAGRLDPVEALRHE
jgi:lipoprotein-releasing system permease protein